MTTPRQNSKKREILSHVFKNCQSKSGVLDAQSYRIEHEDWIEQLQILVQQRYLVIEEDFYRPSLGALTVIKNSESEKELLRCEAMFNILREHFKNNSTRNTHKKLSVLVSELGIEFTQVVQTTQFLLDASSLWCGGHSNNLSDPETSSVLPGEAIISIKSFKNLIERTMQWLIPSQQEDLFTSTATLMFHQPKSMETLELHPAPIVTSFLYKLNSDIIISIIGKVGLTINWDLTSDQQYSQKTRLRAYIPRIESAFQKLDKIQRLLLSQNLIREIFLERPDFTEEMDSALGTIGWKITSGTLTSETINLREQFFPNGAEHTAYVELRRILGLATSEIYIVDPYMDDTIFTMLKTIHKENLRILLLGSKFPVDFQLEATKFEKEFSDSSMKIRKCKDFHDRFIILDNRICFHLGASIKDAGGRAFMISQVEEPIIVNSLLSFAAEKWEKAISL